MPFWLDSGRYGAVGRLAALGSLSVAFAALAPGWTEPLLYYRQLTDAFHPLEQVEEEAKGFFFYFFSNEYIYIRIKPLEEVRDRTDR